MGYGITKLQCMVCEKRRTFYGWLPFADQIWLQNEGLECCNQQTHIIGQEEVEQ